MFRVLGVYNCGLETHIFICQENVTQGAGLKYNVHLKLWSNETISVLTLGIHSLIYMKWIVKNQYEYCKHN